MNLTFYRFRSIDALIDKYHELENQEIYFSALDEMNDPMEGFKDLFWQGDPIVWRNLLRHYLLCLMKTIAIALIAGNDYKSSISRDLIFGTSVDLPTPQMKEIYESICGAFFASYGLEQLPSLIAECKYAFRRDDLEFILRAIHGVSFSLIFKIFREKKIVPSIESGPPDLGSAAMAVELLKKTLTDIASLEAGRDPKTLRILFSATNHVFSQEILQRYLSDKNEFTRAWHSIFYSFPEQYVDQIGDLVFAGWYVACFVNDPSHAAMWGNYADGHRGVGLQFRAEVNANDQPVLNLRGISGTSGIGKDSVMTYGDRALTFDKMNYVETFESIDFFRMIGRLPIPKLRSGWYADEEGKISECADILLTSEEEWRKRYLRSFLNQLSAKSSDWRHEDEYRLNLTSALDLFSEKKDRKLTYRFSDLEGIVFGIRTPLNDKERIIDIIRAKCKHEGRKTFSFSQAAYASYSGKIEIRPLDLLEVE